MTNGRTMGNGTDDAGNGRERRIFPRLEQLAISPTPGLPRLMDIGALADLLDFNVRHVRRLVAERRIPFSSGAPAAFDAEEIAAWLEQARVPP